jgi:hypothetical protein
MKHHAIWKAWVAMRWRCRSGMQGVRPRYHGRGIRVCERWETFENFRDDMLPTWQSGLTLERRDNDLGYFPENCYWATRQEQTRNRRVTRRVQTPWGEILLWDACIKAGLRYGTVWYRLKAGCSVDEALGLVPSTTIRLRL